MYNVYLISSEYNNRKFYKIGWTKRDPNKRLKELKTANSQNLKIEKVFKTKFGPKIEKNLHRIFDKKRKNGEWFSLNKREVDEFIIECQKQHDMFKLLVENNTWVQEKSKEFQKYI
jgi:hypothetical protein